MACSCLCRVYVFVCSFLSLSLSLSLSLYVYVRVLLNKPYVGYWMLDCGVCLILTQCMEGSDAFLFGSLCGKSWKPELLHMLYFLGERRISIAVGSH